MAGSKNRNGGSANAGVRATLLVWLLFLFAYVWSTLHPESAAGKWVADNAQVLATVITAAVTSAYVVMTYQLLCLTRSMAKWEHGAECTVQFERYTFSGKPPDVLAESFDWATAWEQESLGRNRILASPTATAARRTIQGPQEWETVLIRVDEKHSVKRLQLQVQLTFLVVGQSYEQTFPYDLTRELSPGSSVRIALWPTDLVPPSHWLEASGTFSDRTGMNIIEATRVTRG